LPKDDTNSFPFSYLKTHQISPFFLGIVSFGELATTGLSTVLMVLSQVWTHWGLNWFFLPNTIFVICLNFQQQNPLTNQYLSHLSSENCEIKSIKSDFPRTFREHQECPQNFNTVFSFNSI
jgi:hypothetical protein